MNQVIKTNNTSENAPSRSHLLAALEGDVVQRAAVIDRAGALETWLQRITQAKTIEEVRAITAEYNK